MTRVLWHYNYVYYVRAPQPTDLDWDVIHFSRYTLAKIYVKDKNAIVSQTKTIKLGRSSNEDGLVKVTSFGALSLFFGGISS